MDGQAAGKKDTGYSQLDMAWTTTRTTTIMMMMIIITVIWGCGGGSGGCGCGFDVGPIEKGAWVPCERAEAKKARR